jgi:predicted anti-sigma-YlaC factor YlaD
MRCDEIRENFVDLLYDDTSAANLEVKNHLQTCLECRREFEDLRQARKYLQEWKDEAPPRSISIARQELHIKRTSYWKYLRYGAVAAMVLICLLAIANTELTWTRDGFSLRTGLLRRAPEQTKYYTKSEVRDLMKRALDDSEMRTNETNYLMLQKMLDTVEQDHWLYSRSAHGSAARGGNRN